MKTKVSIIQCKTYDTIPVQEAVRRSVDLLGGMKLFVKPGERILLKPNMLGAREPERAVTTHPEVVRAVVRLVREAGAIPLIGDSPGGAVKGVERVWEKTGIKKVAAEENVELVNFETSSAVEKPIPHRTVRSVHITKAVYDVDGIINIPKLKSHTLAIYTGALKNFYGCVPGLRKAEYHKQAPHPDEFGHLIAEIYLQVKDKVRLNVIDGIVGMEGNGPNNGDLRTLELVAASSDALALDSTLLHVLGYKPKEIEAIHYLATKHAGQSEMKDIELCGDNPAQMPLKKFKFPSNWYMHYVPHFLVNFLGKHIWMKPVIIPELCTNCLMCVQSCPVKTIKAEKGKKPVVMPEHCISCLCCHELCPSKAIELRSSRLSKLVIRQ